MATFGLHRRKQVVHPAVGPMGGHPLCLVMTFVLYLVGCSGRQYTRVFDISSTSLTSDFLRPEQMTAGNDANFAPELSPNGEFVLFVSERSGNKDLWEKRAIGGQIKQLSSHPADDFGPVLSSDGKRIAFVSRRSDAAGNIAIMKTGGSVLGLGGEASEPQVDEIDLFDTEELHPAWFPDNERVIFGVRSPGEEEPALYTTSVKTRKAERLFDWRGSAANVAQDGAHFVFSKKGALYLGDGNGSLRQLTPGGMVKDGHARFSSDSKSVVFTRYYDDTNGDGVVDTSDHSTVWRLDIGESLVSSQNGGASSSSIERTDLNAVPLTTSELPAHFPQIRSPFVYFTLQNHGNLDIYRLPEQGAVNVGLTVEEIFRAFDAESSIERKRHLLSKGQAQFCNRGQDSECGELALRELRWLVQRERTAEAGIVAARIRGAFAANANLVSLGELAMLDLSLAPRSLFRQKAPLSQDEAGQVSKVLDAVLQLTTKPGIDKGRLEGQALLIAAKGKAAIRDFFGAQHDLDTILAKYPDRRWLAAEAAYLAARLTAYSGDQSQESRALLSVVAKYPNDKETIQRAAMDAVELAISSGDERLERLASLRDTSKNLKYVAGFAHRSIALEYIKAKKDTVAINEMRIIVDSYQEDPELRIEMAGQAVRLLEIKGEYAQARQILAGLLATMDASQPGMSKYYLQTRKMLVELILREGESLMRAGEPGQAIKAYRQVIELDAVNLPANRGLVDGANRRKTLGEQLPNLAREAAENPTSAAAQYIYGYALTYQLDGTTDPAKRLNIVEDCLKIIEHARELDGQQLHIHQTIGWLFLQKDAAQKEYRAKGGLVADVKKRWALVRGFFGKVDPDNIEQAIDSYLLAYSLSEEGSIDRANLELNLGNAYYELKNFSKGLEYYVRRIEQLPTIPMRDRKSEGILFRSAGKSAFNADELVLAEKLQRRALRQWEKYGSEADVAFSLDVLALTERELGKYPEAVAIYDRLMKLHQRRSDIGNQAQTQINKGVTQYFGKDYEAALTTMDGAEKLLDGKPFDSDDEEVKAGGDAIKVDLAGQDSAAKGFDRVMQRDLIISTRAAILRANGSRALASVELVRKQRFLSQIDPKRQKEKSRQLAEERSVILNQLATMDVEEGRHKSGAAGFREAAIVARGVCVDPKKTHCKEEKLNLVNAFTVELRRHRLGALSSLERAGVLGQIAEEVSQVSERSKGGNRLDEVYEIKLRRVRYQLLTPVPAADVALQRLRADDEAFLRKALEGDGLDPDERGRAIRALGFPGRGAPSPGAGDGGTESLSWQDLIAAGDTEGGLRALSAIVPEKWRALTAGERVSLNRAVADEVVRHVEKMAILAPLLDRIRLVDVSARLRLKTNKVEQLIAAKAELAASPLTSPLASPLYVMKVGRHSAAVSLGGKSSLRSDAASFETALGAAIADLSLPTQGRLYVVPLDQSYSAGINGVLAKATKARVVWGLVPSDFTIPLFESSLRIGRATSSNVASWAKLKQSREQVLTIRDRVLLDDSSAEGSRLGMASLRKADAMPVLFPDVAGWNLESNSTLLVPNVDCQDPADSALAEGWVGLSLVFALGGGSTLVLPDPAGGVWPAELSQELIVTGPGELVRSHGEIRLIGNPGMRQAEEPAFAAALLGKRREEAEKASDDAAWVKATALWKEVAFLRGIVATNSKSAESDLDEEGLKKGLVAALKAQDYASAMHFQDRILSGRVARIETVKPDEAAELAQSIKKSRLELAKIAVKGQEYERADREFSVLEVQSNASSSWLELAQVQQFKAVSAQARQQFDSALKLYAASRASYFKGGEAKQAALRLLDAANIQKDGLNDLDAALDGYGTASAELQKLGEVDAALLVDLDRANTLVDLGMVRDAISLLESIQPRVPKENLKLSLRIMQALSNAYFRAGNYQKAGELNSSLRTSVKKLEDPDSRAILEIDALNLQGYLTAKLGDVSAGIQIFGVALTLAKRNKLVGKQSILLNNIGFWQRESGQVQASVASFRLALEIDERVKSRLGIAYDLRNLGLALAMLERYEEARTNLEKALQLSRDVKNAYNIAYSLFGLGDVALRRGDIDGAKARFEEASSVAEKSYLQDFFWKGLGAQATVAIRKQDRKKAIALLEKAVGVIEGLRAGLQSESGRSGFQGDHGVQDIYRMLVAQLMEESLFEKAWTLSERSRSRAFIDSMGSQDLGERDPKVEKFVREEIAAKARVEAIERRMTRLEGAALRKAEPEAERARALHQEAVHKLALADPKLVQFTAVEAITAVELSSKLGSDHALVEYMLTDDRLYIWVIRGGRVAGKSVAVSSARLSKLIDESRTLIQNFSTLDYSSKEISSLLIEPVQKDIEGAKGLIIVPHGVLHYLPFAFLAVGNQTLLDRFSISYLESATLARYLSRDKKVFNGSEKVAAFGNPALGKDLDLPFAERESAAIARYFVNAAISIGKEASEDSFRESTGSARILHVASHGEYNQQFPSSSRLKLTKTKKNDGDISVQDVLGMKIGADLVTLSACETGLGKITSGDEIVGLNRAFLFAGARTLVSSLWRISDVASAITIKRFYRNLAAGVPIDEALRNAQLLVRRYYPHPAYWAALRVSGLP